MQYSPKLKKAMAAIKAILDENDIAGMVILHDIGFSEYLLKIDPTYSVAKFDAHQKDAIQFKARLKEDFNGDRALMQQRVAATANMFSLLANTSGVLTMSLIDTCTLFDMIADASHTRGDHTSQSEIDN